LGNNFGIVIGRTLAQQIAASLSSSSSGTLIGNALGEVIGTGLIRSDIKEDLKEFANIDAKTLINQKSLEELDKYNQSIQSWESELKKSTKEIHDVIEEHFKLRMELAELKTSGNMRPKKEDVEEFEKQIKILEAKRDSLRAADEEIRSRKPKREELATPPPLPKIPKIIKPPKIPIEKLPFLDQLKLQLSKMNKSVYGGLLSGPLGKLGLIGIAIGALTRIFGALTRGISNLVKHTAESLEVYAKLDGVLKSTGNTTGFTSSQLKQLANDISKVTNYTDEEVASAQKLLATFSNIKGDIFKGAVKGAIDLASVFEVDPKMAAKQLGKLLNDPLANLSSLKKLGISISDYQKNNIESLINQNKLYEAQRIILGEINSKVGGAATNNANKVKQIANSWGEVKERFGQFFIDLGMGADLFNKWNNLLNSINANMDKIFNSNIYKDTINGIGFLIKATIDLVQLFFALKNPFKFDEAKQQFEDLKRDFKEYIENVKKAKIPQLFNPTKGANDKSTDELTKKLSKATNQAVELKDAIREAFNIGDISDWWDTFLQDTVNFQNRITDSIRQQREAYSNSFNNPTNNNLIKTIEEGNEDQNDAMDINNNLLGQIAKNVGVFA
jgi:hypothetical protein